MSGQTVVLGIVHTTETNNRIKKGILNFIKSEGIPLPIIIVTSKFNQERSLGDSFCSSHRSYPFIYKVHLVANTSLYCS